jgi:recombinational DNA repair protein (RecF pathway)
LLRFETVFLRELGYAPQLEACASCRRPLPHAGELVFSSMAGGVVCGHCRVSPRGIVKLSRTAWQALRQLADDQAWKDRRWPGTEKELRNLYNQYISHLLGRRPRTMAYLGSGP